MSSPQEYQAVLARLETDPPDIRDINDNIKEERWLYFNLDGVKFPASTVDTIRRGESLATFERELIIHFQRVSKAAALYIKALLGGVRQSLEIYRRCDHVTDEYNWVQLSAEERWHAHAEGNLMVALKSMISAEAWRAVEVLRAVPKCRLVLMTAYHFLSPAPSTEEKSLLKYLQEPPDAGPTVSQAAIGIQNWKMRW